MRHLSGRGEQSQEGAAVMKVDLNNYAVFCQKIPAKKLTFLLNKYYFDPIDQAVVSAGAKLRYQNLPKVEAYWQSTNMGEDALLACCASLLCSNTILQMLVTPYGNIPLKVNISIATANVVSLSDTDVIRRASLDASLILELGKCLSKRILIDQATYSLASEKIQAILVEDRKYDNRPLYELAASVWRQSLFWKRLVL